MPAHNTPRADETLTDLLINHLQVLQKKQGFRFSLDAVLLAHFAPIKKNWRIADLGTGTGVIPLLLTTRAPTLEIDAVEIQADIADMAGRSVALNRLDNIHIIRHDLRTLPISYNDRYHMVLSNPPYFPLHSGKINPLPELALARHEIACTLEDLVRHSARLLKSGGHFVLIHRAQRLNDILLLCRQYKLAPRRLRLVHPMHDQPADLLLLDALKSGKPDLKIEPPLMIYQQQNHYSSEILQYYGGQTNE